MTELTSILDKIHERVRLALCVVLVISALGATPALEYCENVPSGYVIVIDVALGGGALVAFALLLAGQRQDRREMRIAEVMFTFTYLMLCVAAFCLYLSFFLNKNSVFMWTVGTYVAASFMPIALILWLVDFVLIMKDMIKIMQ